MSPAKLMLISLGVVLILILLLMGLGEKPVAGDVLTVYCAAGMKNPMEQIAANYLEDTGVSVQLEYGGSGTLLSRIEVGGRGDVYLAADASYIGIARDKGLAAEAMQAAKLRPVIVVAQGNPANIAGLADLVREDIRISLASPDAASVGKVTQKMLEAAGDWDAIQSATQDRGVFKPTVNEVANDVKIGAVQAGIAWDATVLQYPELEAVAIPEAEAFEQRVTLALLAATTQPTAALRFMRYATARDKGLPIFDAMGFPAVEGDAWAERPEITYYSGGVNRVAIEDTLAAFSEREGVRINTVYNGCGILVGQIKMGGRPDVYHTCDATFMAGVEELFGAVDPVSRTKIVLLVGERNPHELHTLGDLGQEGLQIGLCDEEASTLGALTKGLLEDQGVYASVHKNVVVTTPTADLLVSQLTVGKLDAAVVYEANTKFVGEKGDIVYLELPNANATQTYAVARGTKYPRLIERLHEAIRDRETQRRFEGAGFDYLPAVTLN